MGSQAPSLRRLMSARRPIRSCAKPAHRRRRFWGLRRIAALSGFAGGSASDRRPEDLGHSRGIAISAWPAIMSGSPMSWRTTGGAPAQLAAAMPVFRGDRAARVASVARSAGRVCERGNVQQILQSRYWDGLTCLVGRVCYYCQFPRWNVFKE